MPYSTPRFRFWTLAEETVSTSAAIALARPKSLNNQESFDKIMKFMSSDEQKFTELPSLLRSMTVSSSRHSQEEWVDVNKTPCSYPVLPALQTASLNGDSCSDVRKSRTCRATLQMGARVDDYQSGNDTTVPQAAVISGSIGAVRTVLHAGADVNDSQGVCSALYHAFYGQDPEKCDFLLRKGTLVDQENRDSPLIAAIFRGSHEMANHLLEARGNPNSCTRLLHHKWSESSVPHLHHEEEDENDVQLWTPLTAACYWSDIAMIELLLQYGAKLHKGTKFYTSPKSEKYRRSKLGRSGTVGQLCSSDERAMQSCSTDGRFGSPHRANIGGSALKVACQEGHIDVAEYLLAEGIGCRLWYELQNHAGQFEDVLKAAEANGHFNLVALLLKHIAAINDEKSNTSELRHDRALVAGRVDIAHLYREHDLSRYSPNNRPVLAGISERELVAGTNRGRLDTVL
ncbi:Pfs NACHT ankyrin domain-containing protein [Fusarium pseudocircinatum]|uniref:Pfs NACHT ankyrin domain-containing protein n=1 Tax=Fusarium pseudocircinatum TaxID=56676 RepID=A0A8H5UVI4_9HYPO|nr:Pfs NACHT ankyrin domain-containing protein [Fusarium pseudocircinatum]